MGDKGQFAVNEGSAEPDQNITQTEYQNIAEETDKGLVKSQLNDWTEETYTSSEEESLRLESFGHQAIAVPAYWNRDTRMGHQSKAVPAHWKVIGTLE